MPGSSSPMQSRRNANVTRSGRHGSVPRSWSENRNAFGSSVTEQNSARDSIIFRCRANSRIDPMSNAMRRAWCVFVSFSMILRSVVSYNDR